MIAFAVTLVLVWLWRITGSQNEKAETLKRISGHLSGVLGKLDEVKTAVEDHIRQQSELVGEIKQANFLREIKLETILLPQLKSVVETTLDEFKWKRSTDPDAKTLFPVDATDEFRWRVEMGVADRDTSTCLVVSGGLAYDPDPSVVFVVELYFGDRDYPLNFRLSDDFLALVGKQDEIAGATDFEIHQHVLLQHLVRLAVGQYQYALLLRLETGEV